MSATRATGSLHLNEKIINFRNQGKVKDKICLD